MVVVSGRARPARRRRPSAACPDADPFQPRAWQVGEHTSALALADQALSLVDPGSATWCEAQIARANVLLFLGRLDDADAAATAAVEFGGDGTDGRVVQRVASMLFVRSVAGRPEPVAARQLLERASTSSPSTYAWALVVAALIVGDDDRAAAIVRCPR